MVCCQLGKDVLRDNWQASRHYRIDIRYGTRDVVDKCGQIMSAISEALITKDNVHFLLSSLLTMAL